MIHIMMGINEHQDQRYTRGDNNGRDLYLLGVNVLVIKGISATMKPNCRVLMKSMYLYVVLSIYETLNANMSRKLGFESPLPWKRHFSAKAGHFCCGRCRLQ